MEDTNNSFSSISNYTNAVMRPVEPAKVEPGKLEAKKANIFEKELAKKISMLSPEELRAYTTADMQGNDLAQNPVVQDFASLSRTAFLYKYGDEFEQSLNRYNQDALDLTAQKNETRTTSETVADTARDVVKTGGGLVGDVLGLGATAFDAAKKTLKYGLTGFDAVAALPNKAVNYLAGSDVIGMPTKTAPFMDSIPNLGPYVAQGANAFNEMVGSFDSDKRQAQAEQFALEGGLDQQDSEAQYQRDLAASTGRLDDATSWIAKQSRNFSDALMNYNDDPMMMGSLAVSGAALVITGSAAIRAAGRASAIARIASAEGVTAEVAAKTLTTSAGRAVLREEMERVAPMVTMLTEGGSGVTQAQQEIMGLTPEELSKSPLYASLIQGGKSPSEAQMELAAEAGIVALPLSLVGSFLVGKAVAPLESSLLAPKVSGAFGTAAGNAIKNVPKEGFEEMLQGVAGQVASNVGQAYGADLPVALDQGVAQAAADNALGGVYGAGISQAPGAVLGTAGEAGRAVLGGVSAAVDGRLESLKTKADEANAAGSKQRGVEATDLKGLGDALTSEVATRTTSEQPEAKQTAEAAAVVSEAMNRAIYVSAEERAGYVESYPELVAAAPVMEGQAPAEPTPEQPITREAVMAAISKTVLDTSLPEEERVFASINMLLNEDSLQSAASTAVMDSIKALPMEDPLRNTAQQAVKRVKALSRSEGSEQARNLIAGLAPETVDSLIAPQLEDVEAMNPTQKADLRQFVEVMARVNPVGVKPEYLEKVRNKIDGESTPIDKSLAVSQTMAEVIQVSAAAKDALIKEIEAAGGKPYKTQDIVKNEINLFNNGNQLSIVNYRKQIGEAAATGNTQLLKQSLIKLHRFAWSQLNKNEAVNQSIADGGTGTQFPYMAYGPVTEKPYMTKKGAWVKLDSPSSVALGREIWIDTNAVLSLANSAIGAYGEQVGLDAKEYNLVIPAFNEALGSNPIGPRKTGGMSDVDLANQATQRGPRKTGGMSDVDVTNQEAAAAAAVSNQSAPKPITPGTSVPLRTGANNVVLTRKPKSANKFLVNDQAKSDKATKFIGRGSETSRTARYANDWGDLANTGSYAAEDTVFISAEGRRKGRVPPNYGEIRKAIEAGATLVTDVPTERERGYNVGERAVAKFLQDEGYQEVEPGTWKAVQEEAPAAPTEDVAEEAAPVESSTKRWLESAKSSLLTPLNQVNRFLESFKVSKAASSLFATESPSQFILDNLEQLTSLKDSAIAFELDVDQARLMGDVLTEDMPKYVADFRKLFADAFPESAKDPGFKWLREGKKFTVSLSDKLPANFLTESSKDDGSLELDEHVIQASMMAAIQWLALNNVRGGEKMDDERINKMLGNPKDSRVTGAERVAVQSGVLMQPVIQDIARTIEKLMGVEQNTRVSQSFTQGIMTAMASNALKVLADNKIVGVESHNLRRMVRGKDKTITVNTLKMSEEKGELAPNVVQLVQALSNVPDVFTRVFTKDGEKARYIGKPPKAVNQKIIRQPFSKVSPKQDAVTLRLQKMAYRVNQPLYESVEQIGPDFLASMLGLVKITDENRKTFNQKDLLSIEGKNAAIKNSFRGVSGYVDEVDAVAKAEGKTRTDIDIFFDYRFSSVGRLQQQGPITPQGNKLMRELVTVTRAVLNLNNETQLSNLWLTMAQNLGVKVDRMTKDEAVAKAQALVTGSLAPAVAAMRGAKDSGEGMSVEQQKAFSEAFKASGVEFTMKAFHALMTAGQIQSAEAAGGDAMTRFNTSLSFEADGVTDGPINAMVHMKTGPINQEYLDNLRRGGWFFTNDKMTINEQKKGVKNDLYQQAADIFKEMLAAKVQSLEWEEVPYMQSLLRVLSASSDGKSSLLDGFLLKEGESGDIQDTVFDVTRNVLKNPLTVFIYGSSVGGIAGKILSIVEDNLAKVMTEISQSGKPFSEHPLFMNNKNLVQDLELLFNTQVDAEGGLYKVKKMAVRSEFLSRPSRAEIPGDVAAQLRSGIEMFFAGPMTEAIDEVTGDLQKNMLATQKISQVQTAIFKSLFDEKVKERTAYLKDPASKLKEGEQRLYGAQLLSGDDMMSIFRELLSVAPVYDTDDMTYFISGKSSWASDTPVSQNMEKQFQATAELLAPSDASVKVSPYLTIGTGDGQMVLTIYADGTSNLERTLPVFDGIEIGVDMIEGASAEINAAVFKAWMESNPYQAIADGFEQTLRNMDFDALPPNVKAEIKSIMGQRGPVKKADLFGLLAWVKDAADDSAARKRAMARLRSWTDHMGGAGVPHLNEGAEISDEGALEQLQDFHDEEMRSEDQEDPDAVIETISEEVDVLGQYGEKVKGFPGLVSFAPSVMQLMISKQSGASAEQIQMVNTILDNPAMKGFKFFYGTAAELTKLKRKKYKQLSGEAIQDGQIGVFSDVIFLTKKDPETVLHEAVHALTSKAVQSYYANPNKAPAYIKEAMQRLEALRDQFLDLEPNRFAKPARAAIELLREELANPGYDVSQKMDEFLAWTLSNQELINALDKQKVHHNILAQITNKVLRLIKRMIGIESMPGKTMLSNVRFNAEILGTFRPERLENAETEAVLNKIYGDDARLAALEKQFVNQLDATFEATMPLSEDMEADQNFASKVAEARDQASKAARSLSNNGFALNDRQTNAFKAVYAVLMSDMAMDPSALSRASKLYNHAIGKLTPEAFLEANDIAPGNQTLAEEIRAKKQSAVFTGSTSQSGKKGQSDTLATFMALAQVQPELRSMLAKMDPPKVMDIKVQNVDSAIEWVLASANDKLINLSLARRSQPKTVLGQLDLVAGVVSQVKTENRLLAVYDKFNVFEKANIYAANALNTGSQKAGSYLRGKTLATDSKVGKTLYGAGALIAALGSKEEMGVVAKGTTEFINTLKGFDGTRALLRDIVGATKDTEELYALLNRVKQSVDKMRQDFRQQVPEVLAKSFSRKLTKAEWQHLIVGLGKTDMMIFGRDKAFELLSNPDTIKGEIEALSAKLKELAPKQAVLYEKKINALAVYMTQRKVISDNLSQNATSIARLHGEGFAPRGVKLSEVTKVIDELTTLRAYQMLEAPVRKSVEALVQSENNGMRVLVGYHATTRALENDRLMSTTEGKRPGVALYNGLKGYIPEVVQQGHEIKIASGFQNEMLRAQGWTQLQEYIGDESTRTLGKQYYYVSSVAGKNAFHQGAAQTVHSTWNGVDVRFGFRRGKDIGGIILGAEARAIREERSEMEMIASHDLPPGEYLIPLIGADGIISGYQMPLDPDVTSQLPTDEHLGRMLGVWSGRIIEEDLANEMNRELLKTLKKVYDAASTKERRGFVNVADDNIKDKDPVIADMWNTMGWRIKEDAAEIFGSQSFLPVRKDMVDDAMGYRSAGITDLWTGVTRLSPKTTKTLRKTIYVIMGEKGYQRLKKSEDVAGTLVSFAKQNIVTRSVKVIARNIIHNGSHLVLLGMNPVTVVNQSAKKLVEINTLVKNREEIRRLEVNLAAVANDPREVKVLTARIKVLEGVNNKLSIKPLIDAGEFGTVSEGMTEADIAIREGGVAEYIEKLVNKMPETAAGVARNALMTKGSPLYQAMNRTVQYGDFVAKAVLYDHLVKSQKMDPKAAMNKVSEEFVNYVRAAGRVRDYMESVTGLVWFLNYPLRMSKVALNLVRDRPLAALSIMSGAVTPVVDTALTSTVFTELLSGGMDFNLGPEMGLDNLISAPFLGLFGIDHAVNLSPLVPFGN